MFRGLSSGGPLSCGTSGTTRIQPSIIRGEKCSGNAFSDESHDGTTSHRPDDQITPVGQTERRPHLPSTNAKFIFTLRNRKSEIPTL